MGTKNQSLRFFFGPWIAIADTSKVSVLVDFVDSFEIVGIRWGFSCVGWVGDVECILEISGRMLLRHEKCVEIPERGFNIGVCWHFFKSHFKEDVSEFFSHFHEGVQCTCFWWYSQRIEIIRFESRSFPGTTASQLLLV